VSLAKPSPTSRWTRPTCRPSDTWLGSPTRRSIQPDRVS
jgi:hypothetical protein